MHFRAKAAAKREAETMQHLGEVCMAQRSRGKTSEISGGRRRVRDFQTVGLNGVFGYFCRRGQKYPAPGRGMSLWTIPPSTRSVDTSATLRRTTQCEHWAAFTQGRLYAAALPRHTGRCTPRVLVPLRSTAWASPPTEVLSRVRRCDGGEGS